MKKVFNSFFVIIAAMVTFAGCAKQEIDAPATPETKTVQFFANSIETKTAFGTPDGTTYPTLWNVGDKVKVLLNIEQVGGTEKIADVECEADLAESARFEVAFAPNTAPESYTYYAVCPSSAYNAKSSADGRITVIIPTDQTPLETTVDKDAQIIYAVAPADADQTSVDMDFHHLTAYGKFSLVNLTSEVSSVSQVKIVAPEDLYISGKWNYLVENGTISVHTKDMSNEITITTTQTENIWFSCGPVDVSGKTFKFIVTTDKGDLEKTVTFPTGSKFESGTIKKFSLDMTDISVETPETPDTPENPEVTTQYYEKVTSAPADWSGKYLLVNENAAMTLSAISTTSTKYGIGKEVSISNGKIVATDELTTCQVEIAKATSTTDAYVMKFAGKYLTWTSGNSLNVAESESINTNWNITLSDSNSKISNCNDATRIIYWNPSSPRFACYAKSGQDMVQLYVLVESSDEGGETPVEKTLESISVSDAKTEYTVGDGFEKPTVTATYSDSSTEDVTAAAEFTGYDMAKADTYTVTVSYSGKTTTYSIKVSAAQGGGDVGGTSYSLLWSDTKTQSGYTSSETSITASDGSVWAIKGYLRNSTNQFIQLGKGGANYITTPVASVPITKITVTCGSSYYLTVCTTDGTELMNKQPGGGNTDYDNVVEFDLSSYSYTQVKIISRRSSGTSNAAVYIQSVVVE